MSIQHDIMEVSSTSKDGVGFEHGQVPQPCHVSEVLGESSDLGPAKFKGPGPWCVRLISPLQTITKHYVPTDHQTTIKKKQ